MKKIYVKDLLRIIKGSQLISGNQNFVLSNFCKDTRMLKKDDIYIGIRGEKYDGNIFFGEAFELGAKCVIVDNPNIDYSEYRDKTIIFVPNSVKCLQELAQYKRSLYDIPVIAITGSVGKTTTKDMIAAVMSKKYNVLKTEGNYNNEIGLPLTILGLSDEEAMVLEMGMSSFGEIELLSKIAMPTISVITTIGSSHIEYLGSRENILKAKLEILEGMKEKILVVNNDNDLLHEYATSHDVITVGIENKSDYTAVNINSDYSSFDIDGYVTSVKNQYKNSAYLTNMMLAYAVGRMVGISDSEYKNAMDGLVLTSKRLEAVNSNKGYFIINDAYNASPESMNVAIEYLSRIKCKRRIAVLGDMLELGTFSQELHENVGNIVYKNKIDILITVGDMAKYIALGAKMCGFDNDNIYSFKDNLECIEFLNKFLRKDDAVIFKASNGMKLYDVIDQIK